MRVCDVATYLHCLVGECLVEFPHEVHGLLVEQPDDLQDNHQLLFSHLIVTQNTRRKK